MAEGCNYILRADFRQVLQQYPRRGHLSPEEETNDVKLQECWQTLPAATDFLRIFQDPSDGVSVITRILPSAKSFLAARYTCFTKSRNKKQ